jgi:hypothetical protein
LEKLRRGISGNWNDEISSVYIDYALGSVGVALWENHDFRGACILIEAKPGRTVNLADFGWNDRASSIALQPGNVPPYTGPPFNCQLLHFD